MFPTEVEQLTLFPAGTLDHASLLVTPGSDEARKMTATSGRKLHAFCPKSAPVGLLARMLLDTSVWGSTTCYLTWKAKVTKQSRLYFQLVPSTPHTDETECSLWPTPTASDGTTGAIIGKNDIFRITSTGKPRKVNQNGTDGSVGLARLVQLWPTPTASQDWKPIRPLAPSEANGSHGTMLVGAVGHQEPQNVGGQLNPEWVEVLMNFPPRWTEVD
jgi:hypothetical protein